MGEYIEKIKPNDIKLEEHIEIVKNNNIKLEEYIKLPHINSDIKNILIAVQRNGEDIIKLAEEINSKK